MEIIQSAQENIKENKKNEGKKKGKILKRKTRKIRVR
jgi:hypothetical protein